MLKKVISYTDFNGNTKSKICYFNLNRPELMEMRRSPLEEMQKIITRIRGMEDPDSELSTVEKDEIQEKMGAILRDLVIQSYGIKSDDGESFSKRVGNRRYGAGEDFTETMAYDALYMEMISKPKNLIEFVRMIIPEDARNSLNDNPEYQMEMRELESISAE